MELTNGGTVLLDPADLALVSGYKWRRFDSKKQQYAITWIKTERGWRPVLMHRLILGLKEGDGIRVDHIDGNGLNNQRSNFRLVSNSQNLQNRIGLDIRNTSGYRNVSWDKSRRKWVVMLKANNRRIHVGRYDDIEVANTAAIEARKTYMTHAQECAT